MPTYLGRFFLYPEVDNCYDRYMKAMTKIFDAVGESGKWKEVVAKEAAGMTLDETVPHFDRAAVRHRFGEALRRAEQADKAEGDGGE